MIDWNSEQDPQLNALVAKCDPPPVDRLDVEALRRSIQGRAVPILARRRRIGAWKVWTAPAALSLALAAGLAAILLTGPSPALAPATTPQPETLVTADLSEEEFQALVSGQADTRSLLLMAAGEL